MNTTLENKAGASLGASLGIVGVLGGMGPLATIDFMHKMLRATPAASDQEHVPVVVSSIPQVPDRTAAWRGEGASPLAAMLASGQRLAEAGAGLVVMPCNTAHLWFDELHAALGLPMLHLVDVALAEALALAGQGARIGLLATDATLASALYQQRELAHADFQWLLPTVQERADLVMPGIAAVKAGDLARGATLLNQAAEALAQRGAQALVLGCTEIPLVLGPVSSPLPMVDATAALARRAVAWSLAQREAALAV
ncbi:aspartate/glutamate racemase family protein [Aquabacterium sp.]|uniref:aspartate/glutamate racemase family protein n=1 Tax=Aquabacterium sp. TaxID=1872578 RepID=UPI002B7B3357|nr:amino acid racemase [Aquabacterium sp.]HSW03131.1 amino acid racemase [Aquabacterium sp.]